MNQDPDVICRADAPVIQSTPLVFRVDGRTDPVTAADRQLAGRSQRRARHSSARGHNSLPGRRRRRRRVDGPEPAELRVTMKINDAVAPG